MKIQITKTAAEALGLLKTPNNEYFINKDSNFTANDISKICAHYESLLVAEKHKLLQVVSTASPISQKQVLLSEINNRT